MLILAIMGILIGVGSFALLLWTWLTEPDDHFPTP